MTRKQVELQVGDRLVPVNKRVTQEKINRFEAAGRALITAGEVLPAPANIHTDAERARQMGLEQPIASGQMSFAYIHEMLAGQFGEDFRRGGKLSATFRKPVYGGDTVTAFGVVTKRTVSDQRTTLTLAVWLQNQIGEKTSVGTAEVTIPSPLT